MDLSTKVLRRAKKPFIQIGLILLFFVLLALWTSWLFSGALIGLMLVHEYGHIWAFKKRGVRIKGMYFIPFLGAIIIPDGPIESRKDEAFVSLMGPTFGFVLGIVLWTVFLLTENPTLAAIAFINGLINLFNMVPVSPLDGGRAAKSIAFSISPILGYIFLVVGLLSAVLLTVLTNLFILGAFIFFLGLLDLIYERRQRQEGIILPKMRPKEIVLWSIFYVLLSAGLFMLISAALAVPNLNMAFLQLVQ